MTSLRKIRLDLATPPEVAIRAALAAVEAMPADVRLTTASMHIQSALDCVATYVDEQMVSAGLDDGTSLAEERNALQAASDECSRQTATDKAEERARIIAWLRDVGVGPSLTASALRKAADDLASEQSPL